jgi:hypothetical protein
MRRGRVSGYVGLALTVSFVAFVHWEIFQLNDETLGVSAGSVATIMTVSGVCWMLAGHRLLVSRSGRVIG